MAHLDEPTPRLDRARAGIAESRATHRDPAPKADVFRDAAGAVLCGRELKLQFERMKCPEGLRSRTLAPRLRGAGLTIAGARDRRQSEAVCGAANSSALDGRLGTQKKWAWADPYGVRALAA